MEGYGQFCRVAQALEVIGERWTLLVVRELLEGSTRFSEIQRGVPRMSRSMLAQRLRSLVDAGVIERAGGGYRLTTAGRELESVVMACGTWGARWTRHRIDRTDVDLALLMWDIRRRIDLESTPDRPVLVRMEFRGAPPGKERFYLHIKPVEADLCLTNPGVHIDVCLTTTPGTMTRVWLGDLPFEEALRTGAIEAEGPHDLLRALPRWFKLSVFATVPRPRAS